MNSMMDRRQFSKLISAGTLGVLSGCSFGKQFDIVIMNSNIIDGSGKAAFKADIGVKGNKITAIDNLQKASADIIIDGSNFVAAPGFIDIHTHTDLELLVNGNAESKIMQGVTTEVAGNCGSSPFPMTDEDFREYDEGVFKKYNFHADWQDINGFFKALQRDRISINYATFTGHGDLRAFAVGKNDVPAAADQLKKMKYILEETMANGSFGLSTGLEYAPGSYASTEELIELNKVVAQKGGVYATHMRNEDDTVEEAIEEALKICRESKVSLQISHFKACNKANWHKTDNILKMIHSASESGLPVLADRYPYIAYSTGLMVFLPLWSRQGNGKEILARLQNKNDLPKIKEYAESRGERIGGWDRVVISYCLEEKSKAYEGKSVAACADELGMQVFDFIRDILIENKLRVSIVGFAMDEDNLKKVLSSPLVMAGSDGSAVSPKGLLAQGKPHPRFYGTFPRVLGKYSREEKLFDLATAVKKMTSMPAQKLGLKNRGLIAKNNFADLVVFNPDTVIDKATFVDPHQFAAGIEYVIVNGVLTVKNGRHTGARSGEILRHI